MAESIGATIKLDGEKEYRKAINEITQAQKTLTSEIKLAGKELESATGKEKDNTKQKELLNRKIEEQQKKIETLNKAVETSAQKYGEDSTQCNKWKQQLADAKSELIDMNKELDKLNKESGTESFGDKLKDAGKSVSDAGKSISKFGQSTKKVGKTLSTHVTAPIMAIGAAAVAAFNEVDAGTDTIIKKTGASGEALDAMEQSMENIATTIPVSFEDAGSAIGEVNTRFGVTGESLESLSKQFLEFAELNSQDVSDAVDKTQKAMEAFRVDTKDAGAVLDTFNKVGQDTGISMDDLESDLTTNATAFQGLGMDIDDAANFLGKMAKSGADTSTVLKGLSKVQQKAAADGKTMSEELQLALSDEHAAIDIFGKQAGPKLYDAFQNGTLAIEDFCGQEGGLEAALGNISTTYEKTLDPADKFASVMNNVKTLGADIAEDMAPMLEDALGILKDTVDDVKKKWDGLSDNQKDFILKAGLIIGAVGPLVLAFGSVTDAIGKITSGVGGAISSLGDLIKKSQDTTGSDGLGGIVGFVATHPGFGIAAASALAVAGLSTITSAILTNKTEAGRFQKKIDNLYDAISSHKADADDFIQSAKDQADKMATEKEEVEKLKNSIEDLQGKTKLTSDEQNKMAGYVAELNSIYPELGLKIDDTTGKLTDESKARLDNVDAMIAEANAAAYQETITELEKKKLQAMQDLKDAQDALTEATTNYTTEQQKLEENAPAIDSFSSGIEYANKYKGAMDEAGAAVDAARLSLSNIQSEIDNTTTAYQNETATLQQNIQTQSANTETTKSATTAAQEFAAIGDVVALAQETIAPAAEAAKDKIGELAKKYIEAKDSAIESAEAQVGAFDQIKSSEDVTLQSMIEGLESQAEAYSNYASNMDTLRQGDLESVQNLSASQRESYNAILQQIASMGIDGADYLAQLTQAAEANDGSLEEILDNYGNVQGAKDAYGTAVAEMVTDSDTATASMENDFSKSGSKIASDTGKNMSSAAKSVSDSTAQMAEDAETNMASTEGSVSDAMTNVNSDANTVNDAKSTVSEAWSDISKSTDESWQAIHDKVRDMMSDINTMVDRRTGTVNRTLTAGWDSAKYETESAWSTIENTIQNSMSMAGNAVRNAVNEIAGELRYLSNRFANTNLSFQQHIAVPHFYMYGSFDAQTGQTPSISTSWYKKAYENAIEFTTPTVIPTMSGLKGFGDGAGGEIVIGENKLLDTISTAVKNGGGGAVINVTVYPSQGMDEKELADLVTERIQSAVSRKEMVFA